MRILFFLSLVLWAPFCRAADLSFSRWEKEIAAFETSDRTNRPPEGSVVFTGSSSIRFWSTLKQDFAPIPVVNRGFGGSQIADATAFVDRIVLPYKPRAVVFYSGDNDIASGKSPSVVLRDFKEFVASVRAAQPEVPIILLGIKPSPSRWALKDKVIEANKLLREFCQQSKNVRYIDVFTPMLDEKGEPRHDIFREDKLHMNSKGYAIWTAILKPALQEIMPKRQGPG